MDLLPAELRAQLPALYAQEKNPDPVVHFKLFLTGTNWTWFITEGQQEEDDFILFGYVSGLEEEWGYVSLAELESIRLHGLFSVERDLYFEPGPFSEIIARHRKERGG